MSTSRDRLYDGLTYKVYRDYGLFRYLVTDPDGGLIACTATMRGARRVIRRHRRQGAPRGWWEHPIVHSESR